MHVHFDGMQVLKFLVILIAPRLADWLRLSVLSIEVGLGNNYDKSKKQLKLEFASLLHSILGSAFLGRYYETIHSRAEEDWIE